MIDISFLIPTCRPFNTNAAIVIDSIKDVLSQTDYTYEILLYSKETPLYNDIIWIKEQNDGTAINGYNELFWISKGQYIFVLNDKWRINNKILKAIPFLESSDFKERKYKITTINVHHTFDYAVTDMPILGGCKELQHKLPQELKHSRFLNEKHRYCIFGFPVFQRDVVKKYLNNHLANPKFKNRFWDNWLSFYIGEQGEFPIVCFDTYMDMFGGTGININDEHDFNTFCELAVNLIKGNNLNYV